MKKFLVLLVLLSSNIFAMECRQKAQNVAISEGYKTLREYGYVNVVDTKIVEIIHMWKEEYEVTVFAGEYDGPNSGEYTYRIKLEVMPACEVKEVKLVE